MVEQTSHSRTDLEDFLGSVDGAVVDIERSGHPPFVKGGLERHDQGVDVLVEEELPVSAEPASIVNESDESGLIGLAVDLEIGAEQGVALPHVVGMRLGKGQTTLVGALIFGLEEIVLFDDAAEGIGSDLRSCEPTFFQAEAIDGREGGSLMMEFG